MPGQPAADLTLLPSGARAVITLGHGAGSPMTSPLLEGFCDALAAHGIGTHRFNFPYMAAGRRAPDRAPVLIEAFRQAHARAAELVSGTKLKDVAVRRELYSKDAAALQAAHDPMLDLARLIDGPAREARKTYDAQEEIKIQAYAEIARARFAIEGTGSFPDATFTLRLSYGTVRGYEQDGKQIPAFTDFAGLYQRSAEHDNKPPFDLPQRWIDKKANLNLATHFDFVSDADIIGGNSGSPVVNKDNEFVGIIFDGNIQSLVLDCIYTNTQARAVSVDSAAIIEALRKVYDAGALADEFLNVRR